MSGSKFTGGGVPYGYIIDSVSVFALDEVRAAVVKEIYENRAAGSSLRQIAGMLNEKGMKSVRGGDWTKQSVSYILGNRAYIGEYIQRYGVCDTKDSERTAL